MRSHNTRRYSPTVCCAFVSRYHWIDGFLSAAPLARSDNARLTNGERVCWQTSRARGYRTQRVPDARRSRDARHAVAKLSPAQLQALREIRKPCSVLSWIAGAGKTNMLLILLGWLLQPGTDNFVVVAAPTNSIVKDLYEKISGLVGSVGILRLGVEHDGERLLDLNENFLQSIINDSSTEEI